MFDELEQLRDTPVMQQLLGHYAGPGAADREAWQGRLMHLEDVEPRELVKLHGELIAAGWVELNVGHHACCYRATAAGLRALQRVRKDPTCADDDATQLVAGNGKEPVPDGGSGAPPPTRRGRRKTKPVLAKEASASMA